MMPWGRRIARCKFRDVINNRAVNLTRSFSACARASLSKVTELGSWDIEAFRQFAFEPQTPAKLICIREKLPPACSKWFLHEHQHDFSPLDRTPTSSELRTAFWSEYENTVVPLELTSDADSFSSVSGFQRADAPLKLLLTYLSNPRSPSSASMAPTHSIYLAQCDLRDLPDSLQSDIPTPDLVRRAGKGDIYSSSLWMGRPPTYTPLHRDPNPNLFVQLAGQKIIRLFMPEIGKAIFDHVQQSLMNSSQSQGRDGGANMSPVAASAALRGEEMMQGAEKRLLHEVVWQNTTAKSQIDQHIHEATLSMGEALFIPKGWWHSVKGVGEGITASANWWFR